MTRIDEFKFAEISNGHRRPRRRVEDGRNAGESLVGAVIVRRGSQAVMYTYRDGRTCRHPDGEFHDCAYVEARNRLIPIADQFAAYHVSAADDPSGMKRARVFCAKMTELAREKGIAP